MYLDYDGELFEQHAIRSRTFTPPLTKVPVWGQEITDPKHTWGFSSGTLGMLLWLFLISFVGP